MKFVSYLTALTSVLALGNAVFQEGLEDWTGFGGRFTDRSWDYTPPVSGKEFCVSIKGTLKNAISKGSYTQLIFFTGLNTRIYMATKDIGPLGTGLQTFKFCAPVPPLGAGHPMGVNFQGRNQDKDVLFVLDGTMTIQASILTKTRLQIQE